MLITTHASAYNSQSSIAARHQRMANVCFGDGHVKSMTKDALTDIGWPNVTEF